MNLPALAEIKARLSAATPGADVPVIEGACKYAQVSEANVDGEYTVYDPFTVSEELAEFMNNAPTDISRLISALELAIEQRDSVMGDYSLDYIAKIIEMREEFNAAIARVLEGK